MNILLTSGGTKIPIDMVRSITNMSSGTFGSKMCKHLLEKEHHIDFLMAEGSKTPFEFRYRQEELSMDLDPLKTFMDWKNFTGITRSFYNPYTYKTFRDYEKQLLELCDNYVYDVIILAAAVSDYEVTNYVDGKIRTKGNLTLELAPLPKLISQIRTLQPEAYLVGFKLLVNSTDDELMDAAEQSLATNKCDIVVANDLRDIKKGQHQLFVVSKKGVEKIKTGDVSKHLVDYIHQKASYKEDSERAGQWYMVRESK